jgi:hypothetical protein
MSSQKNTFSKTVLKNSLLIITPFIFEKISYLVLFICSQMEDFVITLITFPARETVFGTF